MPAESSRIDVLVNQTGTWLLPEDMIMEGIAVAFRGEGVAEAELSLTYVSDGEIQALNSQYFGRDRPTDVIAFGLNDPGDSILGDVYVGYEQAQRQAREAAVPLDEELVRLAIHGTLHVLGFRHPEGEDRIESQMFLRQEAVVREVMDKPVG